MGVGIAAASSSSRRRNSSSKLCRAVVRVCVCVCVCAVCVFVCTRVHAMPVLHFCVQRVDIMRKCLDDGVAAERVRPLSCRRSHPSRPRCQVNTRSPAFRSALGHPVKSAEHTAECHASASRSPDPVLFLLRLARGTTRTRRAMNSTMPARSLAAAEALGIQQNHATKSLITVVVMSHHIRQQDDTVRCGSTTIKRTPNTVH